MPLKDLIENDKIEDGTEITVGDNKVTLGELRAAVRNPEGFVPRQEFERVSGERDQLSTNILGLLKNAADSVRDDGSGQPAAPKDPREMLREVLKPILEDKEYDFENDQYAGKAMKIAEDRAYKRAVADFNSQFEPFRKGVEDNIKSVAALATLADEKNWFRLNRGELPKRPDGKDYSLTDLRQLALANRITDERGYPDYDKLKDALTAPTREAAKMTAAEERGYKKAMEDARKAAAGNLPYFPGAGRSGAPEKKPVDVSGKSAAQIIDAALTEALNDSDILGMVQQ